MKFPVLAAFVAPLVLPLLTGCGRGPTIDASSDEAFKASLQEVSAALEPETRKEFESSMHALLIAGFEGMKLLEMSADTENGGMERRFKAMLDGKTAAEVIAKAESLAARRAETERQAAADELAKLGEKLDGDARTADLLGRFEVHQSRFSYSKNGFLDNGVIELSVTNSTDRAVARAYFDATLATPGREVPWVEGPFNYSIPGGIEPGESDTWRLSPNMFGEWSNAPADRQDMVLTVEVIRLDGADGQPLFPERFTKKDADAARVAIEAAGDGIGERVAAKLAAWERGRAERFAAEQGRQAALNAEATEQAALEQAAEAEAAARRVAEEAAARKAAEEKAASKEAEEAARKASYIAEHVELYDVEASYMESVLNGRVPGVLFKLRNSGTATLDRVEVTYYFRDKAGTTIAEEDFYPVSVSSFSLSGNNDPLKPGYVWQMERGRFYPASSVPSEWEEGNFEAKVTDIQFAEEL